MLDATTLEKNKKPSSQAAMKKAVKAAKKSPQAPKNVEVVANGQGDTAKVTLPENQNRVIQTVIPIVDHGILPSWSHLTGEIKALEAKGEEPHLILTADKLKNNDSPQSRGDMADGQKYKYHVVSKAEIEKHGLKRANVQKSANGVRATARAHHSAKIRKDRGYLPL